MVTTTLPTIFDRIEELDTTLHKIAGRFCTAEVSEDDIFQGVVEKILLSCKPTDTRSFICQCATWHAKNMLASERIYKQYVGLAIENVGEEDEPYDILEVAGSTEPAPEEWTLRKELVLVILKIVEDMDEPNRKIIVSLIQGNSQQSIADEMGLSRSAITNRVALMRGTFQTAGVIPV